MRYAITFLLLGSCFVALALRTGGWGYLLLWPGLSAALVGLGYAGLGSRVFGKRRDGGYALWAKLVHGPYMWITLGVWYVLRWLVPENPADEVAPGVWVGRRPLCSEIPADVKWVVDLTAEFRVAARVCAGREYVCYPTLDAHVADEATFAGAARHVAGLEGAVYVHCAQGHGRSAALVAAVMIARGLAADVNDAERRMVAARPRVGLKPVQRRMVEKITPALKNGHAVEAGI
ncbi:MAG TPA: hypothetical protein VK986_20940 [Tepidisphaeraceae bacterium]|nr:hypothetical protein [Tepidisphaeraceae bacterium]